MWVTRKTRFRVLKNCKPSLFSRAALFLIKEIVSPRIRLQYVKM